MNALYERWDFATSTVLKSSAQELADLEQLIRQFESNYASARAGIETILP